MNDAASFIKMYTDQLNQVLNNLPADKFLEINAALNEARENGRQIFSVGNGGSAAAASHMVCDFGKNTREDGKNRIRAICLSDNIPSIMAYANDEGYDVIFSEQLLALGKAGDILIAISGSGNSANILKVIETAREMQIKVIGLTGFQGGKMKALTDICLVVPSDSMEMIEDVHLIINHILAGLLRGAVMYGH
ncbi:MAG: SIS domain-containing protein [Chloroflexota bacterium]